MGLVVTVQPTVEPITPAEAVAHLRIGTGNNEPAPDAPTVALISPAVAGNVDNGAHRYRVTFVTADGETDGGTISAAVTVADKTINGRVTVSAIPLGGSSVTSRKLYRTVAAGSSYLLLATIADNTTTSYTDNIADSSLGAGVPSTNTTADPELNSLIKAARQYCETVLNRAIITQTLALTLDHFPNYCGWGCDADCSRIYGARNGFRCDTDLIRLPRPNLLTVTSVTYVDPDGATQTLDPATYTVDTASLPGRILLNYGLSWPSIRYQRNAVTITYTAGYGPARSNVPETIRSAMKLILGDLYENRESVVMDVRAAVSQNPTVDALLWSERFMEAA